MAIGLGFDAVNSEYNRRTLSRILSQPIYRDALLFGKFLAGLVTLAISLIALWLLVIGLGLFSSAFRRAGRKWRAFSVFLLVTIVYAGVWLALAHAVLDPVPLGRNRGARCARPVAVPHVIWPCCWRSRADYCAAGPAL